jgi:hypothetical protein
VPGLCTPSEAIGSARDAGLLLERDVDLTELLRLGRPRDRLIAWVSPVARALGLTVLPFFGNLVGGNALQCGVRAGLVTYRLLVFRSE